MPQVPELGMHIPYPYISSAGYYVSTTHLEENERFKFMADIYPKIRVINDVNASTDEIAAGTVTVFCKDLRGANGKHSGRKL